jgi:hypothetical protein
MNNQDFLILTASLVVLVMGSLLLFYWFLQKQMRLWAQNENKFRETIRNEWVQQDRDARIEIQSSLQNSFYIV